MRPNYEPVGRPRKPQDQGAFGKKDVGATSDPTHQQDTDHFFRGWVGGVGWGGVGWGRDRP